MLFNSLHFLIFFPVVATLYFALPHRFRWFLLLAASAWFYMAWKPVYIVFIVLLAVIDYVAGVSIAGARTRARKRLFLAMSLTANLGILFTFKYCGFFLDSAQTLLDALHVSYALPVVKLLLPVGISFHTFQAMSYTIEVYRGAVEPERHFGIFSLYILFFPQLVAGPIERPQHMLHQFRREHSFDAERLGRSLQLMLWGLFKKVCVADRLGPVVDQVYADPASHSRGAVLLATYFFAFQIYCDFSGYSDIALGAAKALGFDLMVNFRRPYFARSVPEFWKRWHISLSTWFRDYVYIPLGGNRVGPARWYVNAMIVFLVSGLWHGADWTFVAWGALHGLYFASSSFLAPARARVADATGLAKFPRLRDALGLVGTFHLVVFAWIFFRATHMSGALAVIGRLFAHHGGGQSIDPAMTALCVAPIVVLVAVEILQSRTPLRERIALLPGPARWGLYYAAVYAVLFLGVFEKREFIYFRF